MEKIHNHYTLQMRQYKSLLCAKFLQKSYDKLKNETCTIASIIFFQVDHFQFVPASLSALIIQQHPFGVFSSPFFFCGPTDKECNVILLRHGIQGERFKIVSLFQSLCEVCLYILEIQLYFLSYDIQIDSANISIINHTIV